MKIGKSKLIIILLLILLGMMPQAYAKTSIEIKPNSSTVYTNKTISEFFDETMAMKNIGEGLEGSNVDVHMATNTDWAIFAYFSNSQYGKVGNVTIGEKTYTSTNGNVTGMMNLGATNTYTASVISNYTDIVDTSETAEPYDYGKRIIDKAKNSEYQYVDLIIDNQDYRKDAAIRTGYVSRLPAYPYSVRVGLFTIGAGNVWPYGNGAYAYPTGAAYTSQTFRPVFWN